MDSVEVHTLSTASGNTSPVSSILVFLAVVFGIIWYLNRREGNLPPGPTIGLKLLREIMNPYRYVYLTNLSEKYGPIYSFRITRSLIVVVNSAHLVKEALIEKADIFSERNVNAAILLGSGGSKGSIVFSNGEEWKELRRFGSHAMRSFGVGKRSLGYKINEESRHLIEATLHHGGKPFDPVHVISNAVSNIICSISFGDRYDYDDPKFQKLLSVLRGLTRNPPSGILPQIFPYLIYLPPYRANTLRSNIMMKFISGLVEEHLATLDTNDARDIIDMFLIEADKEKRGRSSGGSVFDKSRVWRTIFDLFTAGSDTTSNSLLWALAIFCNHPDVQDKMYEEIKTVVGLEKLPVYEDRLNLPYSEAVLLEIQRFRLVVPIVPHGTKQDATLGGYHIPRGSRVLINLWATHHDPTEWKDPDQFCPERFLDEGNNVLHPEAHSPFSLGRRVCLGESLAKMELFLFLTSLVQRFRFFVPAGREPPSLIGRLGITLSPESYEICAETRT